MMDSDGTGSVGDALFYYLTSPHLKKRHFMSTSHLPFFRYGTIISTKAILDKTTNKCKGKSTLSIFTQRKGEKTPVPQFNAESSLFTGYGFVDFESPACAEGAVKGLQAKGIQAQMAKVGIWVLHRPAVVRLFACK